MQYLLNASEFAQLQQCAITAEVKHKTELQELCTLAAIYVPVPRPWAGDEPPAPWGCILSPEHDPGYCDDCPAQKLCPYERKRYSQ